jgi:hypothetical protein
MDKQEEMQIIVDYGLLSKRQTRRRLIENRGKVLKHLFQVNRLREKELTKLHVTVDPWTSKFIWDESRGDYSHVMALKEQVSATWRHLHSHWAAYVKYVNGGGTWYLVPMEKKERRKALRKWRLKPLWEYEHIAFDEAELNVFPGIQVYSKIPNYSSKIDLI